MPAELPEVISDAVKQLLHDGMREEYNHGVTAGINMCIKGLEGAVEHPSIANSTVKDGLDTAIYILKGIVVDEGLIHIPNSNAQN